ncbi:MAG: hypothetical protein FWH03_02200 [Firmicutes bacterium]|nr:hypothetical protein [Bacillota bacterium]
METRIRVKTDFATVFLLNGTFSENAEFFLYDTSNPIYITVLPLSAHLLPYTVKIAGGKPVSNEKLCAAFSAGDALHVKLHPRYNYIYTADAVSASASATHAERLFRAVKQKNYAAARQFLSPALSQSVDDEGLWAFFADYTEIVADDFSSPKKRGAFYLIDELGKGTAYLFETAEGLIDNIVENDK